VHGGFNASIGREAEMISKCIVCMARRSSDRRHGGSGSSCPGLILRALLIATLGTLLAELDVVTHRLY
jgi:hypothetical protein